MLDFLGVTSTSETGNEFLRLLSGKYNSLYAVLGDNPVYTQNFAVIGQDISHVENVLAAANQPFTVYRGRTWTLADFAGEAARVYYTWLPMLQQMEAKLAANAAAASGMPRLFEASPGKPIYPPSGTITFTEPVVSAQPVYARPVIQETYVSAEQAYTAAEEQQLAQELGMKPASQQAAILSHPEPGRDTPVAVTSLSEAEKIAYALIGAWASVQQQKELAKRLYNQKQAYLPKYTAQKVSAFRWDYVLYGVLGFAVLGGLVYFLGRKGKGKGATIAPASVTAMTTVPALPAPK